MRFVLSTVGTSILTNQIHNDDPNEWRGLLRDSANQKEDDLQPEARAVIDELTDRALDKLLQGDAALNRRISAELNGIYGIYKGVLPQNSPDLHYLICSDTAQGQKTGELIKAFLEMHKFSVSINPIPGLSTQDTTAFSTGIKNLIKYLEGNVPSRGSGYRVIFNLVGGFKSLQGYMNTFGTFYADEMIYIFDSPNSDLITIPRLPIQMDTAVIQKHRMEFALMTAGKLYPRRELREIPETLLEFLEEDAGETYTGLSVWGTLVWNRSKAELLAAELLPFPQLTYARTFHQDFDKASASQRLKLQETLAKVSYILDRDQGNTYELTGGALNYEKLEGAAGNRGIHTFRLTRGDRVSCLHVNGRLTLRHYGSHDDVYEKEG